MYQSYMMMVHTAQLEVVMRILQLAPSSILSKLHNDALLAGSSLQEGVSTSRGRTS